MKIYTRTGDAGETGLFGGDRVKKNDPRVEAYGTVDELNAALGCARSLGLDAVLDAVVERIQAELFTLGAELACVPSHVARLKMPLLASSHVTRLEGDIDSSEASLPPLSTFILPTGSQSGAALHLARTVCRRAERRTLDLDGVRREIVIYLNRLSDLLFVLARHQNHLNETPETPWSGSQSV